ncbi:hypothetical protein PUN28_001172 [Cardiocondyla obscurior]|uniref:Uncharacterized protein n=1 Tax=Cardiocondyla obscurior TaxID=286306 RepID=A0AAW2H3K5_9HYME
MCRESFRLSSIFVIKKLKINLSQNIFHILLAFDELNTCPCIDRQDVRDRWKITNCKNNRESSFTMLVNCATYRQRQTFNVTRRYFLQILIIAFTTDISILKHLPFINRAFATH